MPVGSAVWARVREFVPAGVSVHYVFPATAFTASSNTLHVLVVITDRDILVLHTGLWSRTNPKSVWLRWNRDTRLGPVDTSMTPEFAVGENVFEIDDQYISVVNAVDAERDPAAGPPDPLPDL
jgi:hypothetical protein